MSNATVSDQLQQMWRTRPYRLPQRGHIAGVAAGIGYRYNVDPVLIRVAFVVGTIFGGAGIVLYLAAWLLFSKAGDTASPAESLVGKGNSSESNTKIVVLIVALIIAVTTLGPVGVGLGGSGVISVLALLAGWWLLHQRQPEPPAFLPGGTVTYRQQGFPISFDNPYNPWAGANYRPPQFEQRTTSYQQYTPYTRLPKSYVPTPPPAKPVSTPAADSTDHVDLTKHDTPAEPALPESPTPPSWDPLGVAPFAWDLPEPTSTTVPAVPEKKRRSRWTSSFIGLALVAAAITGAVAAATDSEWLTPARIAAVALVVVGTGLVLGAFLRKGYGLLIVTGPLAAFVVFASIVGPVQFDGRYSGQQNYAPTTVAGLQPTYTVQGGDLQLDLRGLTLTEDKTIEVDVTAGNATITLPPSMNYRTECVAIAASTTCAEPGVQQGNSPDNSAVLTIDATARAGNLEVIRG
ncbi:PspC domain-containing protein [Rhodococcus sp. BP-252]|uniref:PspC family transcriptional regulator n=1 Tax=Rhodococcoides kyotonense TaxID=398843 RepID=A0A177Y6X9_9NOCA|nr:MULTISPECIES: PspC domain-containing protein [Rhodococcus]MBY6410573.1 PspC domain-containing protein [Rhodococcus sp. BP-320]MBY6417868.1 PspC domain-containing protein [Rhodococcus sp. BP-321]MBY6422863.1 PspC domain-containing protein [Rhodococcus sp. BP-324]MBY6425129.1 PspC domain-containing protein [Rhodococcus sp. BP-323]MBY6430165.1 PspC domain-containing protein [Rhodococcus sp. BP-322]